MDDNPSSQSFMWFPLALMTCRIKLAVRNYLIKALDSVDETAKFGTNRRSKPPPLDAMKAVIDKGMGRRGLDRSPAGVDREERVMEYQEKSELQLSHVSRGAQKLTQMIESLSNAPNLDGPSRYIADDLMQGALDLQESLVMLRKLQEASSAMTDRRRNPRLDVREERERDFADLFGFEGMGSRRFAGNGCRDKLQEIRFSVDESTRNCAGEMKKVIKDSLSRQNLSMSSDDEKMSSCSSRSLSFAASCSFEDMSSEQKTGMDSISSNKQPKRMKSPSLIAKLMGLEEVPLETVQPIMKEEEKKSVNLARPGFDIVMPKAIKRPSTEQIYEPKQKSLQEIIETMQLKGLLKSIQVKDDRTRLRFSGTPQSEQFGKNDFKDDKKNPPIVIMKPMHSPYWEREEAKKDLLFAKPSMKEEIRSVKNVQEKKSSLHELMLQKKIGRKEVKKTEKNRVESFHKDNTVSPEFQKQPKKDGSGAGKKTNRAQKPPLNRKKQEAQGLGSPNSQLKTASAQQAKPDKKPSVAKSDISRQRSTPPAHNLRGPVRPVPQNSISPIKEKKTSGAKPVHKSAPAKAISNTNKLQDGKASALCAIRDVSTTSPLHNDDLPKQAEQERKPCNRGDMKKEHNVFHEVMPQAKIHERFDSNSILPVDKAVDETRAKPGGKKSELAAEVVQLPSKMITVRKMSRTEEDMRWLLLSSQSFLSFAKEIFGIDPQLPTPHRSRDLEEAVTRNAKLFVECGNELLASKRHQRELSSHPLMRAPVLGRTLYASLDQLVEEISNDIEKLSSYTVLDENATPENNLYIRLEKDLRCNEMSINMTWDVGWMDHTYIQESDQVVGEVEEHILSFLVEEMVMDFVR